MHKRGIAIIPALVIAVIAVGAVFGSIVLISYLTVPEPVDTACLDALNSVSLVDSQYSCYDSAIDLSAFSLLFKEPLEGVEVTFTDDDGDHGVVVKNGDANNDLRNLNGDFNDPVSYSSNDIETFVYKGASSSVKVAPIIDGVACRAEDFKTLVPCNPDVSNSIDLQEQSLPTEPDNNLTHLECVSNTCSVVLGAGTSTCNAEGASCGRRGGGGGGGSDSSGSSGSSDTSDSGQTNQEERTYCTPESRLVEECEAIDAPLCGWYDPEKVNCDTESGPCIRSTFPNECEACKSDDILYTTEGDCPLHD